ncbi:patatin-like phospholipase family protein [Bacilliculturomica massiliensis]|uniref:patatin-like phospholipase family protein n=1 Tax=Bacilliculturomica massiliensis TaxID=1917867 RepID=UPI0013EF4FF8|nr:patatin-like phospholipase family protein [Bacilliculturomica massiliensis]
MGYREKKEEKTKSREGGREIKKEERGERSALVLSGGGSRGAYQIGVWQALLEMGIPIDLVAGTSTGAINGAVIAQDGGRGELLEDACSVWRELETDKVFDFSDVLKNGGGCYTDFKKLLEELLDEEKIRRSEIQLGIVTVEFPSMEPRYLWIEDIPEGRLIDYVLASASCFPAIQSYEIGDSRFIDGGYSDNMPVGMALDRGASHVIAVNLDAVGVTKKEKLEDAKQSLMIQSHWDLGNWLRFDRANSRRILRLGYLDAMKACGAYDGELYCFIKGQMDKRHLRGAEQAAAIFELDPGLIYGAEVFHRALAEALAAYADSEKKEIEAVEKGLDNGPLGAVLGKSSLAKNALNGFLTNLAKLPPVNSKTLLILLARHLKGADVKRSLLMSRPALALFSKEIGGAYYLVRSGLV